MTFILTPQRERFAAAALLTVTAALLVYQARTLSLTVDEPTHLLSAYLYWNGRDRLPPGDMPPLIKLVAGWTIRDRKLPVPADLGKPDDTRHEWTAAVEMVSKSSHQNLADLSFHARLPLILFPLGTIFVLWRWGRALFSPAVGLMVAAMFALEPTALGHGAIFKNDHAATFTYLLFWYVLWSQWRKLWPLFAALAGLAAGLAAVSKLSLLILIPLSVVAVAVQGRDWRRIPIAGAVTVVSAYVLILAVYGFQMERLQETDLAVLDQTSAPLPAKAAARVFLAVPAATNMWKGTVTLFQDASFVKQIYLLGGMREDGHRLYFAVAVAVKAAAGVMLPFAAGMVMLWGFGLRSLWLVGPMVVYAGLASLANLQIGLRLILPCLPFAILIGGLALHRLNQTRFGYLAPACVALLALESLTAFPYGIGFFNYPSGGPAHALRYLSESNVDWGQSLPALSASLSRLQLKHVKLFYFGGDTPYRFLKHDQFEFLAPPWSPELAQGERFRPSPGYYAVSAALLSGQLFSEKYRDYFDAFRHMEPIDRAGNSIYVYRVPAQFTGR